MQVVAESARERQHRLAITLSGFTSVKNKMLGHTAEYTQTVVRIENRMPVIVIARIEMWTRVEGEGKDKDNKEFWG